MGKQKSSHCDDEYILFAYSSYISVAAQRVAGITESLGSAASVRGRTALHHRRAKACAIVVGHKITAQRWKMPKNSARCSFRQQTRFFCSLAL
jgi:hypothetical protein